MDYMRHNAEQASVWTAYHAGKPLRVPMAIACSERMLLLDPDRNPTPYTFHDTFTNPDAMFEVQLAFQYWHRMHMPGDIQRGLPDTWTIGVNFQNVYEAAWFGAPIHYLDGEVPDTRPFLNDDNKRMLFDRGIPDPFGGIMQKGLEFIEAMQARAAKETFHNRPIAIGQFYAGFGTDGPFTLACNLRGAAEFCLDLYEDPEYAEELLSYLVEATIARQKAWLHFYDIPTERESNGIADDSIAILSCETYTTMILPHHKRLLDATRKPGAPAWIHLCGDASRHFVTMRDELNATSFDTGFPIDHGKLRRELGPDVTIQGGPHVDLLLHGSPEDVAAETRRILRSGVMEGGKFILKEANNLAPKTPMENLQVMYEVCKEDGVYEEVTA